MKTQAKDAVALAMDWLAQLREEDGAEPPPGDSQPAIDSAPPGGYFGDAAPAAPPAADFGDAAPAAPPASDLRDTAAAAPPAADFGDAAPAAPPAADFWWTAAPSASDPGPAVAPGTTSPGQAGTKADVEITERAVIGDELRMPRAWCEMGACISHYADPAALGEADIRARAIEAGWRADALGRLACPQCQQGESWFWTAHPAVLWDRDTAVAMTTLMAAAVREIARADGPAGVEPGAPPGGGPDAFPGGGPDAFPGGDPGAFPGGEPHVVPGPRPEVARPPGRGRHRGHPAHADRAQ
jgi:hypothetical protein